MILNINKVVFQHVLDSLQESFLFAEFQQNNIRIQVSR